MFQLKGVALFLACAPEDELTMEELKRGLHGQTYLTRNLLRELDEARDELQMLRNQVQQLQGELQDAHDQTQQATARAEKMEAQLHQTEVAAASQKKFHLLEQSRSESRSEEVPGPAEDNTGELHTQQTTDSWQGIDGNLLAGARRILVADPPMLRCMIDGINRHHADGTCRACSSVGHMARNCVVDYRAESTKWPAEEPPVQSVFLMSDFTQQLGN